MPLLARAVLLGSLVPCSCRCRRHHQQGHAGGGSLRSVSGRLGRRHCCLNVCGWNLGHRRLCHFPCHHIMSTVTTCGRAELSALLPPRLHSPPLQPELKQCALLPCYIGVLCDPWAGIQGTMLIVPHSAPSEFQSTHLQMYTWVDLSSILVN